MAHLSSIGAAIYTTLCYTPGSAVPADEAAWELAFAAPVAIENIRSFPAMGTPPNVVKVPVYGSKQSQQIQGQADAPSLEVELNYVPSDWASGSTLGNLIANDTSLFFRFALMSEAPTSPTAVATNNSCYYWVGKIEALLVTPSLTDALTAKLTLSMQSDFYGAYTV